MMLFRGRVLLLIIVYQLPSATEARWPSGRASDSGARGRGFDPHSGRHVVSLSKIHLPPKMYWQYTGSGGSVPT